MAPPKVATALKLIKGTQKPSRVNAAEPMPPVGIPPMPKWLTSPVAVAEWESFSTMLDGLGVLTMADGNSLAMYCYIIGEISLLTGKISETGYVAYDIKINQDTGEEIMINPKANPLAMRLEKLIAELRMYSGLFGLDPSTRSKIPSSPKEPAEPAKKKSHYD